MPCSAKEKRASAVLPQWVRPQLTELVDAAPEGAVKLLTRTGLDWTHKYPAIAAAARSNETPGFHG
jgi:ATP-dependent DNA ligase